MNDPVVLEPPELQPALNIDVLPLIADSVICTDEDGRIVVFNRAAENSFGYSASEVIGQPVEMLLPQSDRPKHLGHVRAFASEQGAADRLMGHLWRSSIPWSRSAPRARPTSRNSRIRSPDG